MMRWLLFLIGVLPSLSLIITWGVPLLYYTVKTVAEEGSLAQPIA